jgi:hypothetical protein
VLGCQYLDWHCPDAYGLVVRVSYRNYRWGDCLTLRGASFQLALRELVRSEG